MNKAAKLVKTKDILSKKLSFDSIRWAKTIGAKNYQGHS